MKLDKLSRKQTQKEKFIDGLIVLIGWIIYPFYHTGKFISKQFHNFFYTKSNFQNNGIFGPGYHSWYEEHFSWGKLSFVLIVILSIIYVIFLR